MSGSDSIKTVGRRQLYLDRSPTRSLPPPRDTILLPSPLQIPTASALLEKVPKLLIQNRYHLHEISMLLI
jgi:hypothetical protein